MPAQPNTIEVIHRPFAFMPTGNPVEWIFESNRQNQYQYIDSPCQPVASFLTNSYFEVRAITIDLPLTATDGWAFTIDGDRYEFKSCFLTSDSSYAQTIYTGTPVVANCANLIGLLILAINRNPAARGRYYAAGQFDQLIECTTGLDFNQYECNAGYVRISVVGQRLGIPIPITVNPLLGSTSIAVETVDRRFLNYRMYLIPHVEIDTYGSNRFVQLPDLNTLAYETEQIETAICVGSDSRFKFDARRLFADYLSEDVPELAQNKTQLVRNAIRQAFVEYGDLHNQPGDDPNPSFSQSYTFIETKFRILNASFDMFRSNYSTRFINLTPLCVEIEQQDYLLKEFFEPTDPTNQKFLTNWKRKTYRNGDRDWLYFWGQPTIIDDTLQAVLTYTCANGLLQNVVSTFQLDDLAPCDAGSLREHLMMLPLHSILEGGPPTDCDPISVCINIEGVNEYVPWEGCTHPGFVKQVYTFVDNPAVIYGWDLGNFTISVPPGPDAGYSAEFGSGCPPSGPPEFARWFTNRPLPIHTRQFSNFNNWVAAVVSFHINFFQASGGGNASYGNYNAATHTLTMFYEISGFPGIDVCTAGVTMCMSRRDGSSAEPSITSGLPECCNPPVNDEVTRLSEFKEFTFDNQCDNNRIGIMYVNPFGLNEMFWLNGDLKENTTANITTYERNILNIANRQANPPDRATAVLSADGSAGWTVDAILEREEDIRMLPELIHSPSIRLLIKTMVMNECDGGFNCDPIYSEQLVPVTLETDSVEMFRRRSEQLEITLEFTSARSRNAAQVF